MRRGLALRRALLAMVSVGALAVLLASCTSPRNALGTNSSRCFRALAVAKSAVHSKGTFDGVRYLSAANFVAAVGHPAGNDKRVPAAVRDTKDSVCVVNYRGSYSAAQVVAGWPAGRVGGHYALVAVDARTNRVLGTLVLHRTPVRFSKI